PLDLGVDGVEAGVAADLVGLRAAVVAVLGEHLCDGQAGGGDGLLMLGQLPFPALQESGEPELRIDQTDLAQLFGGLPYQGEFGQSVQGVSGALHGPVEPFGYLRHTCPGPLEKDPVHRLGVRIKTQLSHRPTPPEVPPSTARITPQSPQLSQPVSSQGTLLRGIRAGSPDVRGGATDVSGVDDRARRSTAPRAPAHRPAPPPGAARGPAGARPCAPRGRRPNPSDALSRPPREPGDRADGGPSGGPRAAPGGPCVPRLGAGPAARQRPGGARRRRRPRYRLRWQLRWPNRLG